MPRRVLKLICGDGACGGGTGERERCFVEKCRIMSKRIYDGDTNSAQIIFVEICRKMSTRSNGDGAGEWANETRYFAKTQVERYILCK